MADDWRLTAEVKEGTGAALGTALNEHELVGQSPLDLRGRVAVSADSSHVFLYASSRAAAEGAREIAESLLAIHGAEATFTLDRWHPLEERWEPADHPLPSTDEEREREKETLAAQDAEDSETSGYASWEVRLDLPSHRAAVELAERLEGEGIPTTRRWRYLLVGAANNPDATALAERLQGEVPSGTEILVQPGGEMTWEVAPRRPLVQFVIPG